MYAASTQPYVEAWHEIPSAESTPPALPQCYSSPAASPTKGSWRRSKNGANDSPIDLDGLNLRRPAISCLREWIEEDHQEGGGDMPYYTWEAEDCSLETVDKDKFCRVMQGRKGLLFVGDSLTGLMVKTLVLMTGGTGITSSDSRGQTLEGVQDDLTFSFEACDSALKLVHVRNDYLDCRTEEEGSPPDTLDIFNGTHQDEPFRDDGQCDVTYKRMAARCLAFADDGTLGQFDTVVVNSGAHPRPREEYRLAMETASETIGAAMKRLHGDRAVLVVRNTVPGHWGCEKRKFNPPVSAEVAARLVAAGPEDYHWKDFHAYNEILEEAFLNNSVHEWKLLDAYSPTILRADSHPGEAGEVLDCLHYCMPGPVDHWVRLLYNILLVDFTHEQASRRYS
eukprot:g10810.t1